jgi:large subunit ribosomal protein L9
MEIILLERVAKLGQMGDIVRVRDGYARNFLLPKGKALRATQDNKTKFETMKAQLEVRNLELKSEAEKVGAKIDGKAFVVLRQAGETGQLYGSVSTRDLTAILADGGFAVERSQLALNAPIKTIGLHKIPVMLHPEVAVTIAVNVARNADEAVRQARGETVTGRAEDIEEVEAGSAEDFFENPDAAGAREASVPGQGEGAEKAG